MVEHFLAKEGVASSNLVSCSIFFPSPAALRFWRDEMLPNGEESMRPYFDESLEVPLDEAEIDRLRRRLGRRGESAAGG